jgi:hypothetical protein
VTTFELQFLETQESVRAHIQECEGRHMQQVAYSTFHDALTQICYGCKKIRTNIGGRSG